MIWRKRLKVFYFLHPTNDENREQRKSFAVYVCKMWFGLRRLFCGLEIFSNFFVLDAKKMKKVFWPYFTLGKVFVWDDIVSAFAIYSTSMSHVWYRRNNPLSAPLSSLPHLTLTSSRSEFLSRFGSTRYMPEFRKRNVEFFASREGIFYLKQISLFHKDIIFFTNTFICTEKVLWFQPYLSSDTGPKGYEKTHNHSILSHFTKIGKMYLKLYLSKKESHWSGMCKTIKQFRRKVGVFRKTHFFDLCQKS